MVAERRQGQGRRVYLGWLLTLIVFATAASFMNGGRANNHFRLSAAIKTQAAADSVKGGVRGIDVSKWQGNINWSQVAKDDVQFAFIRATYGPDSDSYFVTNAQGAHASGIKVGAYHYATFKDRGTMLAEAKAFVEQLKKVNITYPVALDLEIHRGLSKSALTGLAVEFMDYVAAQGYSVMFYSYENFYKQYLDLSKLSAYPFWVANYVEQPKTIEHQIWQYTSKGSVKGIKGDVDINVAGGDFGTKRQVVVNKDISDSVKVFLNESYNAGIDISGPLDYPAVENGMRLGLQAEINKQLGGSVALTGLLHREELDELATITFHSETRGNITRLIQSRLFYKGYYTQPITGHFDSHTIEALAGFQRENGLRVSKTMDQATWYKLFPYSQE